MFHSRRFKASARKLFGALVVASLLGAAAPPATAAQHKGHQMHPPAKPKAKQSPRRPTPKRAAATRTKRAPRRAPRRAARASVASNTVASPSVGAQPADPHTGHTMPAAATPLPPQQATPTPTPAPTPDPHAEHVMPATPTPQRPSPTQHEGHAMPAQQHQGHSMLAQQAAPTPGGQQRPATPAMDHSMHGAQQGGQTQQGQVRRRARTGLIPEGPVVTLEQLERMAAERNPTLAQAQASVRAAEGRRRQAGAFPNPVVGYYGEELAFRDTGNAGEHGVFVEQTIPLGGKLGKARRVFAREREQAEVLAEAQSARVVNSVRMLYFETLGAQQLVELRADLADLAREAVGITKELYNVGQADRPDQLEIEIEAERAEIEMLRAQGDWEQAWRAIGAMVNDPNFRPARLAGSLD